jgi:hypothetical protein
VDLRRLRFWDCVAGIAGALLIASMFLHWYSAGGTTANAWQAFTVNDVFIFIAGLFGIAILAITATQRTAALAQAASGASIFPVLVAAILVVIRTLDPPFPHATREAGLWIGLGSVLVLLIACWRAMGDQSFPAPARSRVEVTTLPVPKGEPQ